MLEPDVLRGTRPVLRGPRGSNVPWLPDIGIIGSHADAERVRQEVKAFIEGTLKLALAEEKSHICHSKQGTIFVGYEVKTYSGDRVIKVKRGSRHTTYKSMSEQLQLHIPAGKLQKFCASKGYGNYEAIKAIHKAKWITLSDAEIILAYNGELRGLANYYALACNVKQELHRLALIWRASLFKTLACKHKSRVSNIAKQLKTEDGYVLTVPGEKKTRSIKVFRLKDLNGHHIDCCVTMYNEKTLNPVQTWLPGFTAMCHYTRFGMASSECPIPQRSSS